MDPDKIAQSTRLAVMLHKAVLSLKQTGLATNHQVHRMAKALAQVEVMSARHSERAS
ncbi:MAG TPA: hypothetical protein VEY69_17750 [Lautropia sp.]|jgi:hypothetical protein|nr:hypothetical protein [Lautropia sp.]